MRLAVLFAIFLSAGGLLAGELDIAREALRDGLWHVARVHAQRVDAPDAREVVFESLAREGRWDSLLNELGEASESEPDLNRYFRALALTETNRRAEADLLAAKGSPDEAWNRQFLRLRARLAADAGNAASAVDLFSSATSHAPLSASDSLALADLRSAAGDASGAAALWRAVVADTNATDAAYASAALGLGEIPLLTNALARAPGVVLARRVGLRLGRALIAADETFSEGEKLICRFVKDAPDGEDARTSFEALAERHLARKEWKSASLLVREAFETWPDSVRSSRLQSVLGWALEGHGDLAGACDAFARAEELAVDEKAQAECAAHQGDLLERLGRADEALEKYRRVTAVFPGTDVARRLEKIIRVRELEREARRRYADFDFIGAQAGFAAVAKADPERAPRMDFLDVLCLYGRGLDDEAEKRALTIVEDGADPSTRAEALLWVAKLFYNRGRWSDAARLFVRFADGSPDSPEAPEALLWSARAFASAGEWQQAVSNVTTLVGRYPATPLRTPALLVQARVLTELARFDEAVLVVDRALSGEGVSTVERRQAGMIRADALFALGSDNPERYREALAAYRELRLEGGLAASARLCLSYKIAKSLEKLRQVDEALDAYYSDVILAYRNGRLEGERFDDEARASFSRAALRVADEFESRGRSGQALQVLRLLATSDVPAAEEASRRISRIEAKGRFL